MSSNNKKGKKYNYINEIKEWQEHQYEPGYYTGGKIPPFLKYLGKPVIIGLLYIMGGILFALMLAFATATNWNKNYIGEIIIAYILFGGIGVIYVLIGFRLIKKSKQNRMKKE